MSKSGLSDAFAAIFRAFYRYPTPIFRTDKETENYFSYRSIDINRFKGLDHVSLNFSKNDLVLLLGLNESGKTSILKAIECFDFNNDPDPNSLKLFFTSIRNKQDIDCSTPTTITAEIDFSQDIDSRFFDKALSSAKLRGESKSIVQAFIDSANNQRSLRIRRVIPFNNGSPGQSYYEFDGEIPFESKKLESTLAQEIVRRCPYILYFEDFQDTIPEKIFTSKRSDGFNSTWYDIIDGLFYNTKPSYSVTKYLGYYNPVNRRDDDARTVLRQVNNVLQDTFTKKWKDLSGVEEIDHTEIAFQETKKYFEIKVAERDGTTYSVHERSKGAIWYLAFLMKTEFRRKKLREGSGKPIYLIDEPASNLHSTAQMNMVEDFERLVEDTTVIYSTHSQYLVSQSNIRNTYVVSRNDGIVSCEKWGEYIKGRNADISYYQPLYDCLQIVPNSFDIPWTKAIITEGPSDAAAIQVMQRLLGISVDFVIYPGSSACNLSTLISLNMGWAASFRILLDSDKEGKRQKDRYVEEFSLSDDQFVMHSRDRPEIEDVFEQSELVELYEFAFGQKVKKVKKNQFLQLMRLLFGKVDAKPDRDHINAIIGNATKDRFMVLIKSLTE